MLKTNAVAVMTVMGFFGTASLLFGETHEKKIDLKGVKCMLCNMQVSENHVVDYEGGKVYFGCAACPPKFSKDT